MPHKGRTHAGWLAVGHMTHALKSKNSTSVFTLKTHSLAGLPSDPVTTPSRSCVKAEKPLRRLMHAERPHRMNGKTGPLQEAGVDDTEERAAPW